MKGLMMDMPLLISSLLQHAERFQADGEIVSRLPEGGIHRYTYREAAVRARQAANLLARLHVQRSERVATLAWNTHRHYELYFAVSGSGAVLHTINPRLFPEQISYIMNHAENRVLFVDLQFVPLVEKLHAHLPLLQHIVVLCGEAQLPASTLPLLSYEALLAAEHDRYEWPPLDEHSAAALCYTSGTTGNPKGVLYTHRSTMLHALGTTAGDALDISGTTAVLPVVPMFHVNAWGVPYSATRAGAKLVLPGPGLDGASLYELIHGEQVTLLLGVPTVWLGLLQYCERERLRMDTVKSVVIGGSAAPLSMIREFDERHGAYVIHGWGMTEMSPMGTINTLTRQLAALPREQRYVAQSRQGKPVYGVEIEIVDEAGKPLPHDGVAFGRLMVRGPWVADGYYKNPDRSAWHEGWFDTGDVATIDATGSMAIVDRAKDVIKSGGEWISSIEIENLAIGHPAVAECAVIGVPHPKWDERPLLLIVPKAGMTVSPQEVLDFLAGKIAKWWMPDRALIVSELPHTPTGKLLKRQLRDDYAQQYLLEATTDTQQA